MQVILGEEVAFSKLTLKEIISKICDGVQARAAQGLYNSLAVLSWWILTKDWIVHISIK